MSNGISRSQLLETAKTQLVAAFDGFAKKPASTQYAAGLILAALLLVATAPFAYNFAWDYVGVSFPVDSKLQELKDSESEVATLRKKNDDAERIRGSEDKFVDDFARLLLISEETQLLLPPRTEISNVFERVEQIAKAEKLRTLSFSAAQPGVPVPFTSAPEQQPAQNPAAGQGEDAQKQPQPSNKLFEVTAKAKVVGSYADMARFLSALSTDERINERLVLANTINVSTDGREQTLGVELATYYAPPPENRAAIPDKVKARLEKMRLGQ
jgi:Tfp pilus assembly protein PilO